MRNSVRPLKVQSEREKLLKYDTESKENCREIVSEV